jgi:hypothetical protein
LRDSAGFSPDFPHLLQRLNPVETERSEYFTTIQRQRRLIFYPPAQEQLYQGGRKPGWVAIVFVFKLTGNEQTGWGAIRWDFFSDRPLRNPVSNPHLRWN